MKAGYAGASASLSGKEALTGILLLLAVVGFILWYIKKTASDTVSGAVAAVTAIPKAAAAQTQNRTIAAIKAIVPITLTNTATTPEGIAAEQKATEIMNAAITAGVQQNYNEMSFGGKVLTTGGDILTGGAALEAGATARQRIIDALTPVSIGYNSGYVERWIDSLSWYEKLYYGIDSLGNETPESIRQKLEPAFKEYLQKNFDTSGNQILSGAWSLW